MRASSLFSIATLAVAIATSLVIAPSLASAGGGCTDPSAVVARIFDDADTDGDGRLTAAEYQKARLESYGVSFEETDANGDGATSFEEYAELYRRIHAPSEELEV